MTWVGRFVVPAGGTGLNLDFYPTRSRILSLTVLDENGKVQLDREDVPSSPIAVLVTVPRAKVDRQLRLLADVQGETLVLRKVTSLPPDSANAWTIALEAHSITTEFEQRLTAINKAGGALLNHRLLMCEIDQATTPTMPNNPHAAAIVQLTPWLAERTKLQARRRFDASTVVPAVGATVLGAVVELSTLLVTVLTTKGQALWGIDWFTGVTDTFVHFANGELPTEPGSPQGAPNSAHYFSFAGMALAALTVPAQLATPAEAVLWGNLCPALLGTLEVFRLVYPGKGYQPRYDDYDLTCFTASLPAAQLSAIADGYAATPPAGFEQVFREQAYLAFPGNV
jgi:hypothetical protein